MTLVTCAIIHKENRLLCAQRGKSMSMSGKWELPGGKVEPGETYEACIIRELSEELNILTSVIRQHEMVRHVFENGHAITLIPMECLIVQGIPTAQEHDAVQWVPFPSIFELDWAAADIPVLHNWLQTKKVTH